ncbi:MAG: segregation/condensation protein A [Sporolactobacillus sp.]
MEYKVKLDAFEGPLDLLLHLIKQYEIDIYDIPVSEITDQYLNYIHQMQRLELNIASDYLVMAATLVAMKSRMLLPRQEELDDWSEEPYEDPEDTRQALMRQLIDYKQFKEAAESLREEEAQRLLLLTKPADDLTGFEKPDLSYIAVEDRATVYDMVRAIERMIARKKLQQPLETKIDRQVLPIGQQMHVLLTALKQSQGSISFCQLAASYDRLHLVVTFLAVLELMKKKAIICQQSANFSDILIKFGEEAACFDTGEDTFDY